MVARSYLHVYVKRGKVPRLPCEICGNVKAQAHHDDYSKPLQVRWLCDEHHRQHHKFLAAPKSQTCRCGLPLRAANQSMCKACHANYMRERRSAGSLTATTDSVSIPTT
jgi:hypothetical protein